MWLNKFPVLTDFQLSLWKLIIQWNFDIGSPKGTHTKVNTLVINLPFGFPEAHETWHYKRGEPKNTMSRMTLSQKLDGIWFLNCSTTLLNLDVPRYIEKKRGKYIMILSQKVSFFINT